MFDGILLNFFRWVGAGASNLRLRNNFVRPKLDLEFKEKSEF
jgi:hypothetical protein